MVFLSLLHWPTQFGYICMTIACLFTKSPERQFRFCAMMLVLPAVSMNTDHVFGPGPAANCSCCNLSESLCLQSAMGLVLAVIGTRLCSNCSLFTIISYYHHYCMTQEPWVIAPGIRLKRCFEVSVKKILFFF